ncbi:DNA ligase [Catenovulum agarivorans DS-2]|uniref:DNA ligase n=1 Tax=Catenovulum agarivorans DS-2 TaxID=1328313 RepID=W7QJ18_9ALTE|nr:DNA ligase [Catenovulum agarivorans]EWH11866.1 DNA ligase [Catenovulum agarivorans DS-2]
MQIPTIFSAFVTKFMLLVLFSSRGFAEPIDLMLAEKYSQQINVADYLVSEKYDGVRAYWDGKKLWTRQGNQIIPPKYFVKHLPDFPLDGELWLAREQFARLLSIIHDPQDNRWAEVKFMVFDFPQLNLPFSARYQRMTEFAKQHSTHSPITIVKQFTVANHQQLQNLLDQYVQQGAEGLMLHKASSFYQGKRSDDLIKVKRFEDAEATVVGHIQGKGRFSNVVGALVVEDLKTGKRFKIGSGLSYAERKNPPKIGSIITYKYTGFTKNGLPRFAVFLRIRRH